LDLWKVLLFELQNKSFKKTNPRFCCDRHTEYATHVCFICQLKYSNKLPMVLFNFLCNLCNCTLLYECMVCFSRLHFLSFLFKIPLNLFTTISRRSSLSRIYHTPRSPSQSSPYFSHSYSIAHYLFAKSFGIGRLGPWPNKIILKSLPDIPFTLTCFLMIPQIKNAFMLFYFF
jgi:hypothetical protein